MSGGAFEYKQYYIKEIYERIIEDLNSQGEPMFLLNSEGSPFVIPTYSDNVSKELQSGVYLLKRAYVYATTIDKLISGDYDEDEFLEALKEGLNLIKLEEKDGLPF